MKLVTLIKRPLCGYTNLHKFRQSHEIWTKLESESLGAQTWGGQTMFFFHSVNATRRPSPNMSWTVFFSHSVNAMRRPSPNEVR